MLNVKFTDLNEQYGLTVENGVLHWAPRPVPNANASLTLTKATLDDIQLGNTMIDEAISSNKATVDGQRESFNEFVGLLDKFPFWVQHRHAVIVCTAASVPVGSSRWPADMPG